MHMMHCTCIIYWDKSLHGYNCVDSTVHACSRPLHGYYCSNNHAGVDYMYSASYTVITMQGWRKQFYIGQANQSSIHNFQFSTIINFTYSCDLLNTDRV